jgi:hypothetical protein
MTIAGSFFGYKCERCGSTVDVGAVVGSDSLMCCGIPMEPDPGGRASAANVYCPNCKTAYGLVNSDRCPDCGGAWRRAP